MLDRGKGYADANEDGRSRAYPSRTRYGTAGGDGKARQYLVMSKSFFFGFVTVYDWEWLWGRTAAQIELRTIDQPIIVYKADEKKEVPWKNGRASSKYANDQLRKWREKKKRKEKSGKHIDFLHLMQTEEKKELPI